MTVEDEQREAFKRFRDKITNALKHIIHMVDRSTHLAEPRSVSETTIGLRKARRPPFPGPPPRPPLPLPLQATRVPPLSEGPTCHECACPTPTHRTMILMENHVGIGVIFTSRGNFGCYFGEFGFFFCEFGCYLMGGLPNKR
jgi:hypothetical protein